MSRLTELEKWPGHEEWIWPCDCYSSDHPLRAVWDDEDAEWRYITIDGGLREHGLRSRVASAWKILRGKTIWCSGIVLNDAAIADFKKFINSH